MSETLSDKEFRRLTRMLLIQQELPNGHAVYEPHPITIDSRLVERKLLELKRRVISSSGQEVQFLSLTNYGYYVLTQDRLKLILCLIDLNALGYAVTHIPYLTQEELPILLTHSNQAIRVRAAERMKFCLTPGEELWEKFLAERNKGA